MYGNYPDPNMDPLNLQNQGYQQQLTPGDVSAATQGAPPPFSATQQPPPQMIPGPLDNPAIAQMLNQSAMKIMQDANAPKTRWEKSQDFSNQIMGNVVGPAMQAFGSGGVGMAGADITKRFKDQIESGKEERKQKIKDSIDQIKNMTSAFDNVNKTKVEEFGRTIAQANAQANAQRQLEQAQAQAEFHKQQLELQNQRMALMQKQLDEKIKPTEGGLTAAQRDEKLAGAAKKTEEAKQVKPKTDSLVQARKDKTEIDRGKLKLGEQRNNTYAQRVGVLAGHQAAQDTNAGAKAAEQKRHNQETEKTNAKNADTKGTLAQNKIDHPSGAAGVRAALEAALGQPQKAAMAPQTLDPNNEDHVKTALEFLHKAGGDKNKARQMARDAGFHF